MCIRDRICRAERNSPYYKGYKLLADAAGPKPKSDISLNRPKGEPDVYKRQDTYMSHNQLVDMYNSICQYQETYSQPFEYLLEGELQKPLIEVKDGELQKPFIKLRSPK